MEITPFQPAHLENFEPGEREHSIFLRLGRDLSKNALSLMEGDKCLGIAALAMVKGVPRATSLISDELRSRPFLLHRLVKRSIRKVAEDLNFSIIEASVEPNDWEAQRWANALGFKFHRHEQKLLIYRWTK